MSSPQRVALITGASSGIGRTTAISLSKAGWSLVLFARRIDSLTATRDQCADPSQCLIFGGDVTDEHAVEKVFADAVQRFGRIDLVFNNAGISAAPSRIEDISLAAFQQVVNVNLTGAFLCTREAFKVFKSQSPPGGRIINNGSISAYTPRPLSMAYTATKHAILGLTKSTALEGRSQNIACTQIDIGNAHTDMAAGHSQGALQPNGQVIPEATMDPKHVADVIVHIANLPLDVTVLTVNIMATGMPFVGRG